MDPLIGNFLYHEPAGESWELLLNTRRFYLESWIAQECTFPPLVSGFNHKNKPSEHAVKLPQSRLSKFSSVG